MAGVLILIDGIALFPACCIKKGDQGDAWGTSLIEQVDPDSIAAQLGSAVLFPIGNASPNHTQAGFSRP
jgi:hypothetical protein